MVLYRCVWKIQNMDVNAHLRVKNECRAQKRGHEEFKRLTDLIEKAKFEKLN